MEGIFKKKFFNKSEAKDNVEANRAVDNISEGLVNVDYRITKIDSKDAEVKNFLFSLGCYEGEEITLISILGETYVINIKDARYSIDENLAKAIKVKSI